MIPQGRVHTGFLAHLRELTQFVDRRDDDPTKPVCIIGHSLGGAVAVLLGALLASRHRARQVRITTFGAPKVGKKCFREACGRFTNLHVRHYRHPADLVTKLPYLGFSEIGQVIHLPDHRHSPVWFLYNHRITTYFELVSGL